MAQVARDGAQSKQESLHGSLESYLIAAQSILGGWSQWLAQHERLVLDRNMHMLETHAASAAGFHQDLTRLSEQRAALLADARSAGMICSNLKQLAQGLPQWRFDFDLRERVRDVEQSMTNLRRLSTAAWLLVNQCARVVDETLLLMTSGSTLQSAYVPVPQADMLGGQILDERI